MHNHHAIIETARDCASQADFVRAEMFYRKATDSLSADGEKWHKELLLSQYYLSEIYFQQMRFPIAQSHLVNLLGEWEEDQSIALPLSLAGQVQLEMGNIDEAEVYFDRALDALGWDRELMGPSYSCDYGKVTLRCFTGLALVEAIRCNYSELFRYLEFIEYEAEQLFRNRESMSERVPDLIMQIASDATRIRSYSAQFDALIDCLLGLYRELAWNLVWKA